MALYSDDLWAVLHDGALLERGMPRYEAFSRKQVNQIHAFIRAGARKARAVGQWLPTHQISEASLRVKQWQSASNSKTIRTASMTLS